MVDWLVVVVGSAWVGIAVVGPVSPVRMSAPQWLHVLMCAWRAWRGLGWVFCSCLIHSGVPGGGVGSWSRRSGCFWVFFRGMGSFGVFGKVVSPGVLPCRQVFGDTGDTRFYMYGCNGRVCARCVCYLLVKVVSPVSPISTLTRGNPGDTRGKSCVTLCHLVSPPNVRIFELQTAEHAPAAMCRARCVSTDQHPVHLQLGCERPALDRLQPFFGAPDVVCLA